MNDAPFAKTAQAELDRRAKVIGRFSIAHGNLRGALAHLLELAEAATRNGTPHELLYKFPNRAAEICRTALKEGDPHEQS
jgi:hypothetical protein